MNEHTHTNSIRTSNGAWRLIYNLILFNILIEQSEEKTGLTHTNTLLHAQTLFMPNDDDDICLPAQGVPYNVRIQYLYSNIIT